MQVFGEHAGGAGARACLPIAHSGPVVGADLYKVCDLRLNRLPLDIRVAETGIQKHRRISEPATVDMHPVATDVHEAARHGIRFPFMNETEVLVQEAAERRGQNQEGETESNAPQAVSKHPGHRGVTACDCYRDSKQNASLSSEPTRW